MKDKDYSPNFQAKFQGEIRRSCRAAIDRFGGLRKFADTIGEDESKWFNRLTDGRVVGFDVEWLNRVLEVTGDYRVLLLFFKRGRRIKTRLLMKIAKAFDHVMLPVFKTQDDPTDDTVFILVSNLLKTGQRLLMNREER